jgi:hypothetical protein
VPERPFTVDPLQNLLVFHQRPVPPGAVTAAELTENWIAAARRQLAGATPASFADAMRHALGFAAEAAPSAGGETRPLPTGSTPAPIAGPIRTVLVGAPDPSLESELARAGFRTVQIPFRPFDAEAAAKVSQFETYNRTAASQRVADIVAAARAHPGAALVAGGDAALAGLLAAAIVPIPLAVLDVGPFDPSSDADFVEHLYIPGLRRAGDLPVAASMARGKIVVHDAGERFAVKGLQAQPNKLAPRDIVALLTARR